jgi:hypothetical protein
MSNNNVDHFTNYDNSLPYETTFEYFNNKQKDDVCESGICGFSSSKLYSEYSSNECRYAPSRKQQKSKYYEDLTPKCSKPNWVKDIKPIQNSLLGFTKYSNYSPINNKQLLLDSKQSSVDSKQSSVDSKQSSVDSKQSSVNLVKSNELPSILNKMTLKSEKTQKIKPFVTQPVKTLSKLLPVSKEDKVKLTKRS